MLEAVVVSALAVMDCCEPLERGASGRASCEEMMAGSNGAPDAEAFPVGARRAGGVYLLLPPVTSG